MVDVELLVGEEEERLLKLLSYWLLQLKRPKN